MQIKKMVKTPSKEIQSLKNLEIVVPLKYLRNCWRTLDMPLIRNRCACEDNFRRACEVTLTLTWLKLSFD